MLEDLNDMTPIGLWDKGDGSIGIQRPNGNESQLGSAGLKVRTIINGPKHAVIVYENGDKAQYTYATENLMSI